MYHINQDVFKSTFIDKGGFKHKTNIRFNMFPFNTKVLELDSFENILGAFLRTIYGLKDPEELNRDEILNNILSKVEIQDNSKSALKMLIKDLYFADKKTLKCNGINSYKYIKSTKNDQRISEYLIKAICDADEVRKALENTVTSKNALDSLVEENLPKLEEKVNNINYLSLIPKIKDCFTNDLIYLIKCMNVDFNDVIQLISYYYFFYTSQVILNLNRFGSEPMSVRPVYFCTEWEKTSITRECYVKGWRQIEGRLNTMFSHAVLLEMLNQTDNDCNKRYNYYDIIQEYSSASDDDKKRIFSEIEELKKRYTSSYAADCSQYKADNYCKGDIESLIKAFFDDIMLQFEVTARAKPNEDYKKGFYDFCKNNFLQNRKRSGLMLALTEEMLVLMTRIAIGNKSQIRLNVLFEEFNKRGIYMDKQTQERVVAFYEKLNLIEKKSDSGDAQYVKGIL